MSSSQLGEYHLHLRKRLSKQHEPYPHPDKFKALLDKLAYPVAFFIVIMTLPQVIKVWVGKDVGGLSPFTWLSIAGGNLFWLLYGVVHKEKIIIAANSAAFALNSLVVVGIFLFSAK